MQKQQQQNPGMNMNKNELKERKVVIDEEGNVTITEMMENEYKGSYRNLLTDYNALKQEKENTEYQLSDKHKESLQQHLDKVSEQMDQIKPSLDEAEEKTKLFYEEQKFQGTLKKIQEELDKKISDINTAYMSQVWGNIIKNEERVLESLNLDQKKKFAKIRLRYMQQKRAGQIK